MEVKVNVTTMSQLQVGHDQEGYGNRKCLQSNLGLNYHDFIRKAIEEEIKIYDDDAEGFLCTLSKEGPSWRIRRFNCRGDDGIVLWIFDPESFRDKDKVFKRWLEILA